MKTVHYIAILSLVLLLNSCFKEDELIPPHDQGDVKTVTIELMKDYRYQSYYDLNSGQVVSTNLKKEWDLGFECSPDGWHVILNTSNFMIAARTGSDDFSAPIDTTGFKWRFDKSDGNLDSTAIGNWFTLTEDSSIIYTNEVYVIDRGYDEAGNLRGLRKIIFSGFNEQRFVFRFATLDGSEDITDTVTKDQSVNFMCYSFDDGGKQLNLEPPKYEWDLLFTQYTTMLYTNQGEPYPYIVTGVLSNRMGVEVFQDTLMDFQSIDLNSIKQLEFTTIQDEIGYDWKDITGDVTSGSISYEIIEGINYLVKDQEGYYYKLRFISFYNNSGEKGYPTFEYQKL
jgi:hypothetical protein